MAWCQHTRRIAKSEHLVHGALLILIYLGRLIILSPTNLFVAGLAGITGFILSPVFYIGLGLWLRSRATL